MSQLEFRLDKTGFPLIYIDPLQAYVGFLSLTKIQIEYFVSSTNDAMFDEAWYQTVLGYSGRISASQTTSSNYKQLFVSGIMPREAQRVALWAGPNYNLMTSYEWVMLYDFASKAPAMPNVVDMMESSLGVELKPRVRTVFDALANAVRANTLADQMLLGNGIIDYVYEDPQQTSFTGHGWSSMLLNPREPQRLANRREGARIQNFGCRLIYRG